MLERLASRPESFPGAVLLTGPSPAKLAEEARRLAAILLCPGADPEGRCESCRRATGGFHPDLAVVEPQGVQIRIDGIREAVAFGAGKPYESTRRVAVVSQADKLGLEAGNALLKSLEEPGRHFHWILTTTRADALPPTVRSRCVSVPVAREPRPQRIAFWQEQGFSAEEAVELSGLEPEPAEGARSALEEHRRWQSEIVAALVAGISDRRVAPLLLLAEALAQADSPQSRILPEILADAAAAGTSGELLRSRAVAGGILDLARRIPAETLRLAALKAADAPPDNRRGNKRLHYESVLLDLLENSKEPREGRAGPGDGVGGT
jgi:DNA polymerase III delta subunit-like protein